MAEKTIKTRIQSKHETEANWNKATNFVPLKGEIIIYDPDTTYDYPRIKVGDGKTNVISLKFVTEGVTKQITDGLAGKLGTGAKAADSDKLDGFDSSYFAVAETVNAALAAKSDSGHTHPTYVNQSAFSNIKVSKSGGGSSDVTVAADTATDTVTFAGSNVTITGDATNDKVTFAVADGTTSVKGVVKLNDAVNSTSTTTAATANAVKKAYDAATSAAADAASRSPSTHGHGNITNAGALATANAVVVTDGNKKVVASTSITTTELGYLDGVTSNIQTQLNGKAATHSHPYVKTDGTSKMTGKLDMEMSNPHIHMKDTGYTTDWYFQAYQDQLAFGPTFATAVKTDKSGNMAVPGTVTVENKIKLDYDSTSECLNFVFV